MVKIALYDIDSKIPNLALMKLSAWHKKRGDSVKWYSPLFHNTYDKIYGSKVFTFSDAGYISKDMEMGGSGWDLKKELPYNIEHIYPDYTLYPDCNYALGFLTRGCLRNCAFCIVPKKEGKIRKHAKLEEFCKDQEKVMLLDNNILAYKDHLLELKKLRDSEKQIDFNQGLDIRLITRKNAKLLRELKRWEGLRYRFALDDPALIPIVEKKLKILNNAGISNGIMIFYVLIGFNTTKEEDMKRIKFLHSKGCAIYIMPYKSSNYVRKLKRWVNRYFYKYITFQQYLEGVRK